VGLNVLGCRVDILGQTVNTQDYHWRELPQVLFLLRQMFCRDKHVFVTTKHVFGRDESMLVATKLRINVKTLRKTFVATSIFLSRQRRFCHDKTRLLSQQTRFCRDKMRLLSRQNSACRDKILLVATKRATKRQKFCSRQRQFCRHKCFVAASILLSYFWHLKGLKKCYLL